MKSFLTRRVSAILQQTAYLFTHPAMPVYSDGVKVKVTTQHAILVFWHRQERGQVQ
jgi:hypothetical protein